MASAKMKFFEEKTKKSCSYPNINLNKNVSDFDKKVLKLRLGISEARNILAKTQPNLENIGWKTLRSSMAIDPSGAVPLPPRSVKKSVGTNTEACFVIPYLAYFSLDNPITWGKFLSPTFSQPKDQEWTQTLHRAQEFLKYGPSSQFSPIIFSKVLESDIDFDSSGSTHEFSEVFEDADDEEEDDDDGTCCGGSEEEDSKYVTWNSLISLNCSSSSSTLNHHVPFLTFPSFKTKSMMNLGENRLVPQGGTAHNEDRARSMEILLEDSKTAHLRAPENALMMRQENRQPSEHELRVQKSLNKLDVPEWYRKYSVGGGGGDGRSPGTSGRKEFGSGLAGGWMGLSSSKTSSLTSLQSAGRYSGGRLSTSRLLSTGTSSAGGRCGESLTSPNSTASVSPSPYFERSSFTYGMPYALTRFGGARMSCGASPASLSPSPSPVAGIGGSATSTPTASGPPSRHYSFNKQPYLGWRSQERLASKSLYRSPSERLAADLLKTQTPKPCVAVSVTDSEKSSLANLEISPKKGTASDLSLNNSEESNSHKLNRVRSSIKEVSNAIVDYVNESRPLDEGINGRASPRRGLVWLESSFVGTKPIDSPTTPDTPSILPKKSMEVKKTLFRADESKESKPIASPSGTFGSSTQPMFSRNEQMEERLSNSSSVSSPTLDDILDSLLALRRPPKKLRSANLPVVKEKGHFPSVPIMSTVTTITTASATFRTTSMTSSPARTTIAKIESSFLTNPSATVGICMGQPTQPIKITPIISPVSDWQLRMNQPILDSISHPEEFLFPSSPNDPFSTNPEPLDEILLGLPSLGARAFNISPETNIGAHQEQSEVTFDETDTVKSDFCGIKSHVIGTLAESSLPSSPGKNRRVSFDLDLEDKEEKSSSRSRKDSDSLGQSVIHCRNSKCGKSGVGLEARREFKTCHNCNAYYCSRECRRAHWEKHKKVCMQSRVGALCKQIIAQVRDDSEIVSHLSRISRRGFLAKGRGCVKLFFSSPDRAERFLTGGYPELPEPWYIASGDILPEEMGMSQVYSELSDQCQTYNTENRFVLYVSLCVVNEVPTSGAVKWEREMIARSAKIRLFLPRAIEDETPHHQASGTAHLPTEDVYFLDPAPPFPLEEFLPPHGEGETLILRSVPIPSRQLTPSEERRLREVNFTNIQRHLNERGVDLRRTYPDIYTRLCAYVEKDEPFLPVTIFPRNTVTGTQFTCVIMPESTEDLPNFLNSVSTNQIIDISTPTTPNINSS